jgi:hypothetical protein
MFTGKITAATSLLLLISVMSSMATTNPKGYSFEIETSDSDSKREYKIGSEIAQALLIGSSIFIGTVGKVGEPLKELGNKDDASFAEVDVIVNEWLWGAQNDRGSALRIYKAFPSQAFRRGPWTLWEGIDLEIGKQLLIVLWGEDMKKKRVAEGKAAELALIVSDEHLFPSIREILVQHARYVQDPNNIENAIKILNSKDDFIFGGYLVSYLTYKSHYTDQEIAILVELLGNKHINETGWFFTAKVLMKVMSRDYQPLSDSTRSTVTEALIVRGSSDDLKLAKQAFMALTMLSDSEEIDITPFLSKEHRRKLIENYRKIFRDDLTLYNEHKGFKAQLGLQTP